jgi:hypothetical protein
VLTETDVREPHSSASGLSLEPAQADIRSDSDIDALRAELRALRNKRDALDRRLDALGDCAGMSELVQVGPT